MEAISLTIPEVILFEPRIFTDERGFFFESYNENTFAQAIGLSVKFVQDNHSKSQQGVLRGLHYQIAPMAQGKLVRVIQGEIFDVAVDIRENSPTLGQWVSAYLSAENKKQLWIPEGFAHGFLTLSASAEVLYKTTNFYNKEYDRSIKWNDQTIGINWPQTSKILLSDKDEQAPLFKGTV